VTRPTNEFKPGSRVTGFRVLLEFKLQLAAASSGIVPGGLVKIDDTV
jgi:hypothetical protein